MNPASSAAVPDIKRDGCPRCGMQALSSNDYQSSLKSYVEQLDDDIKVSPDIYKLRLEACKSCGHLINGMCRLCGCFVEMRAAKKSLRCPCRPERWN